MSTFPNDDGGLERSVLDDLGEEITGIAWPVSICMAITIFLVRVLNPTGQSSASTVFIASAAYNENANVRFDLIYCPTVGTPCNLPTPFFHLQPDATSAQKLGGALLNAIIFISVIAAMTIVLFILFKYGVSCRGKSAGGNRTTLNPKP